MENQENKSKGITLIALAITVIILLLLAGISIITLTGDNGLITSSIKAKFKSEVKEIQENLQTKIVEDKNENKYQFGTLSQKLGIVDEYNDKLYIEDGEIVYIQDKVTENEIKWLEEMQIYAKKGVIPIYTKEQFEKIGTGEEIRIEEAGGEKFTFNIDSYYVLQNDIDLERNERNQWNPLCTSFDKRFKGIIDGKNYTISGIYINDNEKENQGLFVYNAGTIKNLKTDGYVSAKNYISGLVVRNESGGKIINCENRVEVSLKKGNYAGGLVTYNSGEIENCVNNELLELYSISGGICGVNTNQGIIKKSYNNHELLVSDFSIGGIVGDNGGIVEKCYNAGNLFKTGTHSRYGKGGIVASNSGTVKNCYNIADIDVDGWNIGGVVGQNNSSGSIENSYNIGSISKKISTGGIVGLNDGIIKNCYTIEDIIEVVGKNNGTLENSSLLNEKQMKLEENIILEGGEEVNFLYILNNGTNVWKEDITGINNGFPVLD